MSLANIIDRFFKVPFYSSLEARPPDIQLNVESVLKPAPLVEEPVYIVTLRIYDQHGNSDAWDTTQRVKEKLYAYKSFYKWFFTKNTPYHTIHFKDGETTILRKNIAKFTVTIRQQETSEDLTNVPYSV